MEKPKLRAGWVIAAMIIVGVLVISVPRILRRPETQFIRTQSNQDLHEELQREKVRANAAEAQVETLLKATDTLLSAPSAAPKEDRPGEYYSLASIKDRANAFIAKGEFGRAVAVYMEGYSELKKTKQQSAHLQVIMVSLARLAKDYPGATEALRLLQQQAQEELARDTSNRKATLELSVLNNHLGDNEQTIALYDSLQSGDARRPGLALVAFDAFVENRRYEEALTARSFASMLDALNAGIARENPSRTPEGWTAYREKIVSDTAKNIEVLAGAGRHDEAGQLMERLLSFDSSPTTRAKIQAHLQRISSSPAGP